MTTQDTRRSVAQTKAAFQQRVQELVAEYFSAPERTLHLADGQILLSQGVRNDRLYYVSEGQLVGRSEGNGDAGDVLIVGPGEFAGVRSFAAPELTSVLTVRAEGPSVVCFASLEDIRSKSGAEPEQVLLPIVTAAMLSRQEFAYRVRVAEKQAEEHAKELQAMSQLGQFSAGVAHELNNAISVIDRGAEWLAGALDRQMKRSLSDEEYTAFSRGLQEGRRIGSREARETARKLRERFGLSFTVARDLSHMGLEDELLERLGRRLHTEAPRLHQLWELGATARDLGVAAVQAAGVVESMKNLGGRAVVAGHADLHQTIELALTILRNVVSDVNVTLDLAPETPFVHANKGELVQVWVNLVHNACEAMERPEREASPSARCRELHIQTRVQGGAVTVAVRDTGPGIPPQLLGRIFDPDFSTKKSGLSFGLGLGLSIVRRIIASVDGSITASNWDHGAEMTVVLPVEPTEEISSQKE